jgi:hypothetical protein
MISVANNMRPQRIARLFDSGANTGARFDLRPSPSLVHGGTSVGELNIAFHQCQLFNIQQIKTSEINSSLEEIQVCTAGAKQGASADANGDAAEVADIPADGEA